MAETVKGINIKLSLDGKDLQNEIKEINKDLREQQKDLRAINTNLRYDSSNLELWRKKQSQLNEILKGTKERLAKQNEQLAKAKEGLKLGTISEAEFRKLERNISYTEADIRRVNSQLEQTKDKLKSLGNEKFDNLAKLGGTLTKSLTAPILGAVAALTALATKGINTADELKNTAQRIGVNVEALQEWNHVATLAGVETGKLEKAFGKVNNILADIALGDVKSFAGVFHALGISLDELEGKSTEEAFEIIRVALSQVEDQSIRTALANKLFGDKLGSDLIPILSMESDEISDLRDEARKLGIITNEQIEQTSGYKDSLDKLKQSTTALSVEIATVMIPMMSKVVDTLQNSVIPAVRTAVEWWNNLSSSTKTIILTLTTLAATIGPVLSIAGKVGPTIKGASVAFKALGSAGMFAGAGINFATLGIGALIAIVVMALMQSESFKELLKELFDVFMKLLEPIMKLVQVLMDALKPILDTVIGIFTRLIDLLVPIIDMILRPIIKQLGFLADLFEMLAPLIEMVGNILNSILGPALELIGKILEPIFKILEKIIKLFEKIFGFITEVGDAVSGVLGGVFEKVTGVFNGITDFVGGAFSKVADFASGTINKVKDVVGDVVGGVKDAVGGAINTVGDFVGNAASKVGGFVSGLFGKVKDTVGGIINNVKEGVSGAVSKVGDFIGNTASKVGDFAKNAVSGVSNVASNIVGGVSNAVSKTKEAVSGVLGKVGGFFANTFNLKKSAQTSNVSNSNSTTNNVTVNTTSSTFDIDSINRALGGKFI